MQIFSQLNLKRSEIFYKLWVISNAFFGFIFVVLTFFFVLRSVQNITQIYTQLNPTLTSIVFSGLLITAMTFIQGSTAYGLLFRRKWVKVTLISHSIAILFSATILLPIFELNGLIDSTLKSGIPYFLLAIYGILSPLYTTQKKYDWIVPVIYLLAIVITISLNLYTQLQ